MDRLAGDLRRELARLGPGGRIQDVVAAWPEAVGPEIARNAWPARIGRDGTLHVTASSSAWAFELAQLAETILGRLSATLDEPLPRLRFAPGPVPEPVAETAPVASAGASEPSPEARARAASLAGGIADPDLRELVTRAAAASLARPASDRRF
jgi:hypothetical protein